MTTGQLKAKKCGACAFELRVHVHFGYVLKRAERFNAVQVFVSS